MRRLTLVVLAMLLAHASAAQVAVSPPLVEVELDSTPANGSVRLVNLGSRTLDVEVSVSNWDLDEHNQVRVLPPSEQSLDQIMVLNPLHFTLGPTSAQTVRYSIRPRVELERGEHRAMIFFSQVRPEGEQDEGLLVLFRMGVAVYGYAGGVTREGTLHSVNADANGARFDITSSGNAHVRMSGQYAIWPAAPFPGADATSAFQGVDQPDFAPPDPVVEAGLLPRTPVLPGTRRTVVLTFSTALEPGDYALDLSGELAGVAVDEAVLLSVAQPTPTPAAPSTTTDSPAPAPADPD